MTRVIRYDSTVDPKYECRFHDDRWRQSLGGESGLGVWKGGKIPVD
jgi:hypothetical protein